MKLATKPGILIFFVAIACLVIGGVAGITASRSSQSTMPNNVLGLLIQSCTEPGKYQELLRSFHVAPLRIMGTSGTDFDGLHPLNGESFVVDIAQDGVTDEFYYQVQYELSLTDEGEMVSGFRVFLLRRDNNQRKCVVEATRRLDLEFAVQAK